MFSRQQSVEFVKGEKLEEDKMDINAIPDIEMLSGKVVEFLEFYDDPKIVELRKNNHPNYLHKLYERFEMMPLSMILRQHSTRNDGWNRGSGVMTYGKSFQTRS